MKTLLRFIVIIMVACVCLTGCAGLDENYDKYSETHGKTVVKNQEVLGAYFEKTAATNQIVLSKLSSENNESAMLLYAILSNKNDQEILMTMKMSAPVAPKTQNDVLNTLVASTIPTIAKWGFGYLVADSLFENLAGVGGTAVTATGGSTVSYNRSDVRSGTEATTVLGSSDSTAKGTNNANATTAE